MQNRWRKKLRILFLLFLSIYCMIGAAVYYFQEKLLFFPVPLAQEYAYQFIHPFEEVFLLTEENASINALHFKVKNPKGVILYFHGNSGNLSRWGNFASFFVEQQYDVFIMDYRTYGKSFGKLSEDAFYKDAQYCYDYLLKQYVETDISLYGRSIGTGVASYLASKNNPKQLILETPYYSIADVAKKRFPLFPVKPLLKYEFPSNQFMLQVVCPVTIFHGTEDKIVPYASGKKLAEINPKNINLITIEGGEHNNLGEFEEYQNKISLLLK